MPFNIFNWLFQDAITAGGPNSDGSEVFHYFWHYLIFCGVGLLIWFYYWVEGRKRFVDRNYPLRDMLDLYLNWLAIICFIGIPIDLARVVMDAYFFSWRFWRYLWLVALLVWAVLWVVYLVRTYPQKRRDKVRLDNFLKYVETESESNKSRSKPTPKQRRQAKRESGRRR